AIALTLPDAVEAPHFDYASFRVGGRIFATMPPDGRHLHVFVDEEDRQRTLALHPDCVEALHWGQRVLGLRLDLHAADATLATRLLVHAWARKAPKRLLPSLSAGMARHVG
ncbi:MAG TPA: MmcQ/YjbR family DNA-binding protein, partial [Luteimonas sp.]|nr:MmcQ/YjbR family DNA-binding protein [Luteimonas sp.]